MKKRGAHHPTLDPFKLPQNTEGAKAMFAN
jgi:hypothetical protein